jgi:hypothetical protein
MATVSIIGLSNSQVGNAQAAEAFVQDATGCASWSVSRSVADQEASLNMVRTYSTNNTILELPCLNAGVPFYASP